MFVFLSYKVLDTFATPCLKNSPKWNRFRGKKKHEQDSHQDIASFLWSRSDFCRSKCVEIHYRLSQLQMKSRIKAPVVIYCHMQIKGSYRTSYITAQWANCTTQGRNEVNSCICGKSKFLSMQFWMGNDGCYLKLVSSRPVNWHPLHSTTSLSTVTLTPQTL